MPIENFKRVLTIAIAIDRGDIRRAVNRATAADLIALRDEVAAGVAEIEIAGDHADGELLPGLDGEVDAQHVRVGFLARPMPRLHEIGQEHLEEQHGGEDMGD